MNTSTAGPSTAASSVAGTGGASSWHRRLVNPPAIPLLVAIAGAAALVYANSLLNGFAFDDVGVIVDNPRVHALNLRDIWLTPYWPSFGQQLGVYRPVAILLYAIQWAAGGGEPWLFHAVSVLLHLTVTLLVFFLLRCLLSAWPAALGALVFAVHPVHTEAVANVVGQAELVTAVAVVAACLVHASRPAGVAVGWGRRVALLALYLLALFTKENSVVLPALLVTTDLAQRRIELSRQGLARYARALWLPFFLLFAAFAFYSIIRLGVLEGAFVGEDTGPQLVYLKEHRLLNAFRAFPEYVRLLFFPNRLSSDYQPAVILPVQSLTPMAFLGLLLLAGTTVLALATPWAPAAGFPAAWFLVSISVVSNLFFPVGILVAERALYLPSIAVSAIVAFAWTALAASSPTRRLPLLGLALVVALPALALRTVTRNPDWKSTTSIVRSIVRDHPESYTAQWATAELYEQKGDRLNASIHYETAYRIYPHNSELLTEYANFLLEDRAYARAIVLLEQAHRSRPTVMRSSSLLAYAYLVAGRYRDALPAIRWLESIGAPPATTLSMRAYAWEQLGAHGLASAAWRVALRQPGVSNWRNWSFLARNLALAGYPADARLAARQAASLASDSAAGAHVAQLARALDTACYRSGAAADTARDRCDGLGDWLRDAALQSATHLQNARPLPLDPVSVDAP